MKQIVHGRAGYDRHGCRCPTCQAANTAHVRAVRAARRARLDQAPADTAHGTHGGYDAGCRCPDCLEHRKRRYAAEEGYRPHWWRDLVTSTYRGARIAWEALRESSAPAYGVAGAAGSDAACYQLTNAEFAELHSPPMLRDVLVALADDRREGAAA